MLETAKKTENTLYKEFDFFEGEGGGHTGFYRGVNPWFWVKKVSYWFVVLQKEKEKMFDDV